MKHSLEQRKSDLRKDGTPKKLVPAHFRVRPVPEHLCRPRKLPSGGWHVPDRTELYIVPATYE